MFANHNMLSEMSLMSIQAPDAAVLVVDDNKVNLAMAAGQLSVFQIKADIAESGREAIEKIGNKHYDIVFMDHMMPEMDGVEVSKSLRNAGNTEEKLCIIALSSNFNENAGEFFRQAGMQDFLSKPIDKQKLAEILGKWLPREKILHVEKTASCPTGQAAENKAINKTIQRLKLIPDLDVEAAIQRCGGNYSAYEPYLVLFDKNVPKMLAALPAKLEDLKKFASLMHGIQMILTNAGAVRLAAEAGDLEEAALGGEQGECEQELPVFTRHLSVLYMKVTEILKHDR